MLWSFASAQVPQLYVNPVLVALATSPSSLRLYSSPASISATAKKTAGVFEKSCPSNVTVASLLRSARVTRILPAFAWLTHLVSLKASHPTRTPSKFRLSHVPMINSKESCVIFCALDVRLCQPPPKLSSENHVTTVGAPTNFFAKDTREVIVCMSADRLTL